MNNQYNIFIILILVLLVSAGCVNKKSPKCDSNYSLEKVKGYVEAKLSENENKTGSVEVKLPRTRYYLKDIDKYECQATIIINYPPNLYKEKRKVNTFCYLSREERSIEYSIEMSQNKPLYFFSTMHSSNSDYVNCYNTEPDDLRKMRDAYNSL